MSDLIRREDAIDAVMNTETVFAVDSLEPYQKTKDVVEALEAIPSADRPQGEWIDAEIPLECGGSMPIQVCNLCKTFYPLAYTGGGHRFCPNCGAKMKGADDETD